MEETMFTLEDAKPLVADDIKELVIVDGEYVAKLTGVMLKPTKDGTNSYYQFSFRIIEGAYEGMLIWNILMQKMKNETQKTMALRWLKSLCIATAIPTIQLNVHGYYDFTPFINSEMIVKVKTTNDTYGIQTRIQSCHKYDALGADKSQFISAVETEFDPSNSGFTKPAP